MWSCHSNRRKAEVARFDLVCTITTIACLYIGCSVFRLHSSIRDITRALIKGRERDELSCWCSCQQVLIFGLLAESEGVAQHIKKKLICIK